MRKYMFIIMLLILPLLAGCSSTKKVSVGDIITFGTYEQDNQRSNGQEPIEWLVLAVEKDRALLVSKYALDLQAYHNGWWQVTWETCDLRTWLNDDFFNSAFSSSEQSQIASVTILNSNNPTYGTNGGNNTKDRIFLLSLDEVKQYFPGENDRLCKATAYAKAQGNIVEDYGYAWWWLRTPGSDNWNALMVEISGKIPADGLAVNYRNFSVRPAFWLKQ